MITDTQNELSEITLPLIEQIPKTAIGLERHLAIGEVIDAQPEEVRFRLKGLLDSWLENMDKNEASDIDLGGLGCDGKVWYRIHGNKKPWAAIPKTTRDDTNFLCHNILMPSQREFLVENRNLDFSYLIENGDTAKRFRADMYLDMEHLALNMRKIETDVRPFKQLNFHPEVAKALSLKFLKFGLTLVTGITGSGKSSTLDTIIDANNRSVESHIVIISSPVELVHKPQKSIVRHREVGRDVMSFREGAVQALRQDPDIIVIGELRDADTIMTALEVTDSGHKTFSTLHTASATESIDRIIGEVPTNEQERVLNRLADVLTCVISQKLVPTLDGKRALAKEVLITTSSVKAAIRNNNTGEIYQMLMEGSAYGMHTLEQDLKRLYEEGKISMDEALNQANNKKRLKEIIS
ncbi:MAG: PilT/PilU family type 4a pilus ATPase [Balneolales bacterium]